MISGDGRYQLSLPDALCTSALLSEEPLLHPVRKIMKIHIVISGKYFIGSVTGVLSVNLNVAFFISL